MEVSEEEEESLTLGDFLKSYAFFYFSQLTVNSLSLAFYGVMAFNSHVPCKQDDDDPNVTEVLVLNFIIGFALHMVNFIVSSFVEPQLRATYRKGVFEEGLTAETR